MSRFGAEAPLLSVREKLGTCPVSSVSRVSLGVVLGRRIRVKVRPEYHFSVIRMEYVWRCLFPTLLFALPASILSFSQRSACFADVCCVRCSLREPIPKGDGDGDGKEGARPRFT